MVQGGRWGRGPRTGWTAVSSSCRAERLRRGDVRARRVGAEDALARRNLAVRRKSVFISSNGAKGRRAPQATRGAQAVLCTQHCHLCERMSQHQQAAPEVRPFLPHRRDSTQLPTRRSGVAPGPAFLIALDSVCAAGAYSLDFVAGRRCAAVLAAPAGGRADHPCHGAQTSLPSQCAREQGTRPSLFRSLWLWRV